MNRQRETEKIILLCMRHFVLYRYYGIIILKSQLLRRKGIVTIRSNIKGREPQLPTFWRARENNYFFRTFSARI